MDAFRDPWPFPGKRVLVEDADDERRRRTTEALAYAGFSVAACAGPGEARCPAVCGDGCAFVERADVVVCRLGSHAPDVVEALRLRHASKPLVIDHGEGDVVGAVRSLVG